MLQLGFLGGSLSWIMTIWQVFFGRPYPSGGKLLVTLEKPLHDYADRQFQQKRDIKRRAAALEFSVDEYNRCKPHRRRNSFCEA